MIAGRENTLTRVRRAVQRQGLLPFLKRQVSVRFNRLFRARLCVWVWRPGMPLAEERTGILIRRYASAEEVPPELVQELTAGDTETFPDRLREEFAGGGVLWVGFIGEKAAGYQWSRNGRHVHNWHFELTEQDVLIYSTVTFYEFRGRGVGPTISARICRDEVAPAGRACADCMVWNTPAVRFLRKTGFEKIAERKPLPDHPD